MKFQCAYRNGLFSLLISVISSVVLIGCGGSSGGGNNVTPQPDDDPPGGNLDNPEALEMISEEIIQLESLGMIPRLDTSENILGTDSNANGARDDIDEYIAMLDIPDREKIATTQVAIAFQRTLEVDTTDLLELQETALANLNAMNCLFDVAPDNWVSLVDVIESITANTEQRVMRYLAYNTALSGSISRLPQGDTCA
jgi:hypothetical protein